MGSSGTRSAPPRQTDSSGSISFANHTKTKPHRSLLGPQKKLFKDNLCSQATRQLSNPHTTQKSNLMVEPGLSLQKTLNSKSNQPPNNDKNSKRKANTLTPNQTKLYTSRKTSLVSSSEKQKQKQNHHQTQRSWNTRRNDYELNSRWGEQKGSVKDSKHLKHSNKQNKTKQKVVPLNRMENSLTNAQALALSVRPASSSELG